MCTNDSNNLHLTGEEARLLGDVIDMFIEGISDARECSTADPNITTVEELLEVQGSLVDDEDTLTGIKERLCRIR